MADPQRPETEADKLYQRDVAARMGERPPAPRGFENGPVVAIPFGTIRLVSNSFTGFLRTHWLEGEGDGVEFDIAAGSGCGNPYLWLSIQDGPTVGFDITQAIPAMIAAAKEHGR